jgi:NAD+ synthase
MHMRSGEIANWLRDRVTAAGGQGLVVGLSGGIDSAVVAGLCQLAMPGRTVAMILPCHGSPADESDARLTTSHFGIPTIRVDLDAVHDQLAADLMNEIARLPGEHRPAPPVTESTDIRARLPVANLKPRLRMTSLYFVANALDYLVAGTSNRSELTIGYFTKHGDGAADLHPIGHLLKSEVRAIARDLGVPDSIIEKPPSAGLWPGQTDEDEIGFTYAELERYLADGPDGVAPALALRIERLVRENDHKRSLIPHP